MLDTLIIDGQSLNLHKIKRVAFEKNTVSLSPSSLEKAAASHHLLLKLLKEGHEIYGANRGVGWNKDQTIQHDQQLAFNQALLFSHSAALPPFASQEEVRTMMLLRLNKALRGHAGLSPQILMAYRDFLNHDIVPVLPKTGSIGEGDIVTLSYIGSAIIGEGSVCYHGERMPTQKALQLCGLSACIPEPKDGLGMVSSNAHGEAISAMLLLETAQWMEWAHLSYCLALEAFSGNIHPLREDVNACRRQDGQILCAEQFREHLDGSYLFLPDPARPLQDPLCYRSAASVYGSCLDIYRYIENLFEKQINASDDNPCLLPESGEIAGSANFETTTLALALEMLGGIFTHLSRMIAFRIIRLDDPVFSGLNRFLTPSPENCIAFGTIQKTIASLDVEIRHLAQSASADFFPLAGQIEDHASNLPFVAEKVRSIVDRLFSLLAIEMMHAAQAIDLRNIHHGLGKNTIKLFHFIRESIPPYERDRCVTEELLALKEKITKHSLQRLLQV